MPESNHHDEYLRLLREGDYTHVLGADEVGFGAWAGPVMTCAVLVPKGWHLYGVNDSKKLKTKAKIEDAYQRLMMDGIRYVVHSVDVEEIDREGLGPSLRKCFRQCLLELHKEQPKTLVVLDGEVEIPEVPHLHFPRADGVVSAVMAASIIAKRTRDNLMIELGQKYPGYGLGDHAGYGTDDHEKALRARGKSPTHRKYTPMERILTGKRGQKIVDFDDDVDFD